MGRFIVRLSLKRRREETACEADDMHIIKTVIVPGLHRLHPEQWIRVYDQSITSSITETTNVPYKGTKNNDDRHCDVTVCKRNICGELIFEVQPEGHKTRDKLKRSLAKVGLRMIYGALDKPDIMYRKGKKGKLYRDPGVRHKKEKSPYKVSFSDLRQQAGFEDKK